MCRKNKKEDDLDTETTFADMNIEGFEWYDKTRKNVRDDGMKRAAPKVTWKEYWEMVRGAFAAYLPSILIILIVFGIVIAIAVLWMMPK